MIIGFLGKGGSGKSTLSTGMVNYSHRNGNKVLAVDADHNMDLSYNLGYEDGGPFIGGSFLPLREEFGLDIKKPTEDIFVGDVTSKRFSFTKPDNYSKKHTVRIEDDLYLMMSGPQSDLVLHGSHCSHSLAAPLKIYLPLLELNDDEVVVVDEKASVDAVSTGIPTGFDLAVIVAEPRIHSIRVAKQIKEMLEWFDVPNIVVLNKSNSKDDIKIFKKEFGQNPFVVLDSCKDPLSENKNINKACGVLFQELSNCKKNTKTRLDRTILKYKRNSNFQKK